MSSPWCCRVAEHWRLPAESYEGRTRLASGRSGWPAFRSAHAAIIAGSPEGDACNGCANSGRRSAPFRSNGRRRKASDAPPFAFDIDSVRNAMAATRALVRASPISSSRVSGRRSGRVLGDAATSFDDTAPLRHTLEPGRLRRLNSGERRVSVARSRSAPATRPTSTTAERRARSEAFHGFRRSAAGIPAVEIDGEHYWDGGVVFNTGLARVRPASVTR